jgi:hypothetical protein
MNHGDRRAGGDRILDVGVPVEPFAVNGKKDVAGANCP